MPRSGLKWLCRATVSVDLHVSKQSVDYKGLGRNVVNSCSIQFLCILLPLYYTLMNSDCFVLLLNMKRSLSKNVFQRFVLTRADLEGGGLGG